MERNMKKSQIVKSIIYILIFVLLFYGVSSVLVAKWQDHNCETDVLKEFYDTKKNTVDVAFIGSSQIAAGASPMTLYENYGISSYALGSSNQNLMCSYYLLKECLKYQDISTVVMDVSMLYVSGDTNSMRKVIDNMPLSKNKLDLILAQRQLEIAQPAWTYVFPIIKYHTRWKSLTEEDFFWTKQEKLQYRGGVLFNGLEAQAYDSICIDNDGPEKAKIIDYELEYFKKILAFCKEKNLNVVLIKTPKANWNLNKHEQAQQFADEAGLPFLDFNTGEMLSAIGFDVTQDMKDMDHLNIRGAEKMSDYIGKYLVEHYELEDHRDSGLFSEEYLAGYHNKRTESYMISSGEVAEYFEYLDNEKYDVIISGTNALAGSWTEEMQQAAEAHGVIQDYRQMPGSRFVWHIRNGECIYQTASDKEIPYEGVFADGTAMSLTNGDNIQLIYGENTAKKGTNGVSFFVYDNSTGKLVDTAGLYYDSTLQRLRVVHDNVLD